METLTNLTKIILRSKEEQMINKGTSKHCSSRHLGDTEKNKCLIARTIKMHLTKLLYVREGVTYCFGISPLKTKLIRNKLSFNHFYRTLLLISISPINNHIKKTYFVFATLCFYHNLTKHGETWCNLTKSWLT